MSASEAPVRAGVRERVPGFGPIQPIASARPRRALSSRFFRSELGMVFGRRRNQIVLAVLAAVPVLIAIAIKVNAPKNGEGPQFFDLVTQNGIFVAFTALTVVVPIFLPLAIAIVAGDSIAGEAHQGTLRYLLVVPVSRARLLAVKYAAVVVYCLAAALIVAAVGLVIGLILFGAGDVTLLSGMSVSMADALGRLLLVMLYVAACLSGFAAIGLFISTLVESAVAAMAATAGVAIAAQIVDNVPQLHAVAPYIFSHWWESFGDLLRTPMAGGDVIHGLVVSVVYLALFGALAWARFAGKDVTS